ncbi:hypothetical protein [Prauserella muralis]|uniref:Uncharacterized protein n=1 Tax=Prauserella muralis TaxID=588067 RepID=A0A2V4BAC2_9PSEU|nr:hypothetical protein [Prauserella muralis]PXY31059.1 hypothetical protein BAY60_01160 [Prauserella muralis]TWE14662.1 hypothetical protein FHX69_6819 [Prauserella muralis]
MSLLSTWLPTAFGASMLVVEVPLVYAAVARSDSGARGLAAMGICLALLVVVNTPALALAPLVATEHDRHRAATLLAYTAGVGAVGTLLLGALALTPAAANLLGAAFGLDAGLLAQVRGGLLGLVPNSLGVALRRYLHGRCIHTGRTRPILRATLVRIAASGAFAFAGIAWWPEHGTLVGGLALSVGAVVEAAMLAVAARPFAVPSGSARARSLLRRHAHLSSNRLLAMLPLLLTTAGIAHAPYAALSLVVWPALYELLMLFASPVSDWEAVSATALRETPRSRSPRRVAWWLAAGFTAAFAAVLGTGAADGYLRGVEAVPADAATLGLSWAPVLLAVPALWVLRAHLHGVLMAAGATGWLVPASAAHVAVLGGAVSCLGLSGLPGVAAAALALVAGLLADVAVTARGVSATAARRIGTVSRASLA